MPRLSPSKRTLALAVLLVAAALGTSWPYLWVDVGTDRARACFAAYTSPRESDAKSCLEHLKWFVAPSHAPWTRAIATYRAEELQVRQTVVDFLDAAVGHPDRQRLAKAGEAMDRAEQTIKMGSTRAELFELGTPVRSAKRSHYTNLVGDRKTLVEKFDQWHDWKVRLHTLEAALTDGGIEKALPIAKHYATYDPRDEDLRIGVAAVLCLGDEPKRAVELLEMVQSDRAGIHHEAMTRDFGAVRAAILICAAKAKVPPLPKPEPEAGRLDVPEARAVLRLRMVGKGPDDAEVRDAAIVAVDLLSRPLRAFGERITLLSALAGTSYPLDANTAADLARPWADAGEPGLFAPVESPYDWLPEVRGIKPSLSSAEYAHAAARFASMATSLADDSRAEGLARVASAASLQAARTAIAEGDHERLARALADAGSVFSSDAARALAFATAWHAAAEHERALAELDRAGTPPDGRVAAAIAVERAELLAALGRGPQALAAVDAGIRDAATSKHRAVEVRGRWLRLLLARKDPALPLDATLTLTRAEDWPWIGPLHENKSWIHPDLDRIGLFERSLAMWDAALRAPPADKRAIRYTILEHRGDAPRARATYMALGAGLLSEGEGDAEVWLDAFYAIDSHRIPARTFAWTRAEASRLLGRSGPSATWKERYRRVSKLASGEPEIARILGL